MEESRITRSLARATRRFALSAGEGGCRQSGQAMRQEVHWGRAEFEVSARRPSGASEKAKTVSTHTLGDSSLCPTDMTSTMSHFTVPLLCPFFPTIPTSRGSTSAPPPVSPEGPRQSADNSWAQSQEVGWLSVCRMKRLQPQ